MLSDPSPWKIRPLQFRPSILHPPRVVSNVVCRLFAWQRWVVDCTHDWRCIVTHLLGRPGLSSLGPSILHPPIVVCRVLKIFWSPPDKSGAGSLPRYPALQFSYWSRNSILSSSYTIEHDLLYGVF